MSAALRRGAAARCDRARAALLPALAPDSAIGNSCEGESAVVAERQHGFQAGRASQRSRLLDELTRRYAAPLQRFFEQRVRNKEDANDLVQDVFLRLSRLSDPQGIEQPQRYLFATAASSLRDNMRRKAVRHEGDHIPLDDAAELQCDITPLRVLEGKAAVTHLLAALMTLPERTRDVFVLRMFEDLRPGEIAEGMGISRRAVEKHFASALKHACEALADWRP